MVTVDDVRQFARTLPRSSERLIRDRVKFRVGKIVYVAFSRLPSRRAVQSTNPLSPTSNPSP
ncbi:hypothetical protein [Nonomuraea polychroma]|uniref:hypothetical protein n=1 Tax=Nonomuraea polychroma TaxID=46176 RepID=UPI0019D47823|nr:hypothetical protein [Nonomuraea polychroma]